MPIFQPFYEMKLKTPKFKVFTFEANEDIMTKFESQDHKNQILKY